MKEKILFIITLVGSFSATIILLIHQALIVFGVDTTGYVDIINYVGMVLAVLILIASMVFLNKYNGIQQKQTVEQKGLITTALDTNANLMQTILPKLASQILTTAEERGNRLLQLTEDKISDMMTKMLPALAEQTMRLVTEKSQNIVDETTAKANATMTLMGDLIPTYSKQISDKVAQTVRENNAHYHKMLTELTALYSTINLPAADSTSVIDISHLTEDFNASLESNLQKLTDVINTNQQLVLTEFMSNLMLQLLPVENVVVEEPVVEAPVVEAPVVEAPDLFTTQTADEPVELTSELIVDEPNLFNTQSDEVDEKSDESITS